LTTTLYAGILLQPAFQLSQANRLLLPALSYDGQIVNVLHQLAVATQGQENTSRSPTSINNELLLVISHFHELLLKDRMILSQLDIKVDDTPSQDLMHEIPELQRPGIPPAV
jgi:hypothetical protein